ncbi:MAG: hypothetical protein ACI9LU_003196, partial [Polaribacter sp.]
FGFIAPQTMPLIPAIRPENNSSSVADKPINTPPKIGHKKLVILNFLIG